MKALQVLLIFALIASFNCADIIAQISCFVSSSGVVNIVKDVVKRVKQGEDFLTIALSLVGQIAPVRDAIMKCFK